MKYNKKPNAWITSVENIRGLEYEKEQPLVGDRVYILEYFGEGNERIAHCVNLTRETKSFGIPESNLQKIKIKPVYRFEYKKEVMEKISEDFLDKNGAEGWELVTIESSGFSKYKTLYFKRIISHEEEEYF